MTAPRHPNTAGDSVSGIAERFELAFAGPARPRIEDFLPPAHPQRFRLLVELIQSELELRLRVGESVRVREYLSRYPELRTEPDALVALLATELKHRPHSQRSQYELDYADLGDVVGRAFRRLESVVEVPGFEVLSVLGSGGMGVVYKARNLKLQRIVALKAIRPMALPAQQAAFRGRFEQEARAISRLHHPNIVQAYSVQESGGVSYLELELVHGPTLEQHIAGKVLPPRQAAELVEQLARAMAHAHANGVIHRDLKPSNVLLSFPPGGSAGDPPIPKITDFGLAKLIEEDGSVTRTREGLGTPEYMAPEQVHDARSVGPAADVWGLGAILYRLLTGRPPFQADTCQATLRQVAAADPVAPSQLTPGVPRDLETICLRCLRKQPESRYGSARDVASDLRRFLDGKPIAARPARAAERLLKWGQRNPVALGLIVALGLLLTVTTAAALMFFRARGQEVEQRRVTLHTAMRLALARGEGEETLRLFQEAKDSGLPITPEMRLDRARAFHLIGDDDAAVREMQTLPRQSLPATADVLEGALWLGEDEHKGRALLERALRERLPIADRLHAEGLLAKSPREALGRFEEALRLEPGHHDARTLAAVGCLLLGEPEKAVRLGEDLRLLFPANARTGVVLALAWAIRGNESKANECLEEIRSAYTAKEFSDRRSLLSALCAGHRLFPHLGTEHKPAEDDLHKIATGWQIAATRFPPDGQIVRRWPPAYREQYNFLWLAYTEAASLVAPDIVPVAARTLTAEQSRSASALFRFRTTNEAEAVRRRLRPQQESTLLFRFALRLRENASAANAGRLMAQAGAEFEEAAASPGLFGTDRAALEWAALCYAQSGEAAVRPKVGEMLRERWRRLPLPRSEARLRQLSEAARVCGEEALGQLIRDQTRR